MRWSYLIPRLIIVGIIWAFMTFGLDPLLRYSTQETLQAITGAKADIEVFETGFFPPRLEVRAVALASHSKPGTNLIEFDEMKLKLAGEPLLRKSYVVEEAFVTGVRFGTPREDDGQLEIQPESDEPTIPPWLTEKMKNIGDEWIENLTEELKSQLDPNTLESYRVGNELYGKWDKRFHEINLKIETARSDLENIKQQVKDAKKGDTMQQVEKYLLLAQRADLMMRTSRATFNEFRTSVPLEVRRDFARLDQAQKNDRAIVGSTLQMLKPDSRRITESLIGEEMYVRLQHMLTWLETLQSYQQELKQPPPPERFRGRDFDFEILNPTPTVLCRKMLLNGELMLGNTPTPFEAVLNDVTSDPKLLGRPAVLNVATAGDTPVRLVVQHDATQEISTTKLAADYTDNKVQNLSAGKPEKNQMTASLSNLHWSAKVTLIEDQIAGRIDVKSDFGNARVVTAHKAAASLAGLAEQSLANISTVNASLTLSGPIRKPDVSVTSDIGDQVMAGFQSAYAAFLPQMKGELVALLDDYVDKQKKELSSKLGGRYTALLADHQKLIDGLAQAKQLASNIRSGNVDPNAVFKQVSQSGILSEKDQQKTDKVMGKANRILDGFNDPNKTIQQALPGLRKKLFR